MSTGLRAGTNNDGYLQVNGTDVLTALSSGNVGIGTSTPNNYNNYNTLTINGTNGGEVDFEINGTLSADIFANSTGLRLQTRTALPIILSTHNGSNLIERLTLTTDGKVRVPDNGMFTAGAGDDLQIYHTGNHSRIYDSGVGKLQLGSDTQVEILNGAFSVPIAQFNPGGSVVLRHNTTTRLETTSTGAKVTGALEVTQEYPTIRPTLDLNFAATKTLDRRITFTRDGVGTYVGEDGLVKYASNNVPRFDHDPTTGESLGILVEAPRTNILGLSTDLTDNHGTDWDAVNGTIAVNQTTAPDGTTTAASYTAAAGNAEHSVVFSELVPTGNSAASVWVKTNTYSIVSLNLYGQANSIVSYNLSTKTVYNQGSNVSRATITEYPNGWYRISATMNCTVANSRVYRLYASTGNFNAGGSESFYYWGPQVESGDFETSYIPTYVSNTSVTRGADLPYIEGSNFSDFYDTTGSGGTFFLEFGGSNTTGTILSLGPDSGHTQTTQFGNSGYTQGLVSSNYNTYNTYGGSGAADGGWNTTGTNKFAFTLTSSQVKLCGNGKSVKTGSGSTPIFTNFTKLTFGGNISWDKTYTSQKKNHIRSIKYYRSLLSDSQLQGLTAQ